MIIITSNCTSPIFFISIGHYQCFLPFFNALLMCCVQCFTKLLWPPFTTQGSSFSFGHAEAALSGGSVPRPWPPFPRRHPGTSGVSSNQVQGFSPPSALCTLVRRLILLWFLHMTILFMFVYASFLHFLYFLDSLVALREEDPTGNHLCSTFYVWHFPPLYKLSIGIK